MFLFFTSLGMAVVTIVLFSTIGEGTPPFKIPESEPSKPEPKPKKTENEAEKARQKRLVDSKKFEEKRKKESLAPFFNMAPIPRQKKPSVEEEEEEKEDKEEKSKDSYSKGKSKLFKR